MPRIGIGVRAAAIALVVNLVVASGNAHAADRQHCAFQLRPVAQHGHLIMARLEPIGCYGSFESSVSAGVRRGSVLIGTEFNGTSYAGSSHDYFAANTCNGTTWEVASLGSFNDTFASGKGFGGCDHNKKFAGSNFGGAVITCTPNCTGYGSLNNDVSSLRWKP